MTGNNFNTTEDFIIKNGTLVRYKGKEKVVEIPDGVTVIGPSAFVGTGIQQVFMKSGVTKIGYKAFMDCPRLSKAELPDTLSEIGESAFMGCDQLCEIDLSRCKELTVIPDYAFAGCLAAKRVVLPDTLLQIGNNAFLRLQKVSEINLPKSLTHIGHFAFAGCGFTSIKLSDTVLAFCGRGIFSDCSNLTSIDLGRSLSEISGEMFKGCISLMSVTIPEGVKKIGEKAFADCSNLSAVSIPDTVSEIEQYCFGRCDKLLYLRLPSALKVLQPLFFFFDKIKELTLPDGLCEIKAEAVTAGVDCICIKNPECILESRSILGPTVLMTNAPPQRLPKNLLENAFLGYTMLLFGGTASKEHLEWYTEYYKRNDDELWITALQKQGNVLRSFVFFLMGRELLTKKHLIYLIESKLFQNDAETTANILHYNARKFGDDFLSGLEL